jgi:3D (Asp-Asp-Asp) domain-containing protein
MNLIVLMGVVLTTYTLSPKENGIDNKKFACGYHLAVPRKIGKVVAVSRDLLYKFPLHSKVQISNSGKFDGVYLVDDVMNKRFKNRVDILVNDANNHYTLNNIVITKINL